MRLLGLMGTVKVRLVWKVGTMPDRWRSRSEPGVPILVPLRWRWRLGVREGGAAMGLKVAGRKPKRGEGEGNGWAVCRYCRVREKWLPCSNQSRKAY